MHQPFNGGNGSYLARDTIRATVMEIRVILVVLAIPLKGEDEDDRVERMAAGGGGATSGSSVVRLLPSTALNYVDLIELVAFESLAFVTGCLAKKS